MCHREDEKYSQQFNYNIKKKSERRVKENQRDSVKDLN